MDENLTVVMGSDLEQCGERGRDGSGDVANQHSPAAAAAAEARTGTLRRRAPVMTFMMTFRGAVPRLSP
ncbi:hypothetical protein JCM9957A_20210 [Kineosporia succinea]